MFDRAKKYFILITLVSSSSWADKSFFQQHPGVCKKNSTFLNLHKDSQSLVAVIKCLDEKGKEIASCKLGKACDRWFYEIYLKQENKYKPLEKSYLISGEKPKISTRNSIISIKSMVRGGSQAQEEDKFRFEDGKLKLVGIEYSIVFNGQMLTEESEPYASDYSINVLNEKVLQTDYFQGAKSNRITCKMNPMFNNLTIANQPNTSIENLECGD